jgi:hypothetical protein
MADAVASRLRDASEMAREIVMAARAGLSPELPRLDGCRVLRSSNVCDPLVLLCAAARKLRLEEAKREADEEISRFQAMQEAALLEASAGVSLVAFYETRSPKACGDCSLGGVSTSRLRCACGVLAGRNS